MEVYLDRRLGRDLGTFGSSNVTSTCGRPLATLDHLEELQRLRL